MVGGDRTEHLECLEIDRIGGDPRGIGAYELSVVHLAYAGLILGNRLLRKCCDVKGFPLRIEMFCGVQLRYVLVSDFWNMAFDTVFQFLILRAKGHYRLC